MRSTQTDIAFNKTMTQNALAGMLRKRNQLVRNPCLKSRSQSYGTNMACVEGLLRNEYKPKNLGELKSGIKEFRATLTPTICKKYINHLKKVIPNVTEVQELPSGH